MYNVGNAKKKKMHRGGPIDHKHIQRYRSQIPVNKYYQYNPHTDYDSESDDDEYPYQYQPDYNIEPEMIIRKRKRHRSKDKWYHSLVDKKTVVYLSITILGFLFFGIVIDPQHLHGGGQINDIISLLQYNGKAIKTSLSSDNTHTSSTNNYDKTNNLSPNHVILKKDDAISILEQPSPQKKYSDVDLNKYKYSADVNTVLIDATIVPKNVNQNGDEDDNTITLVLDTNTLNGITHNGNNKKINNGHYSLISKDGKFDKKEDGYDIIIEREDHSNGRDIEFEEEDDDDFRIEIDRGNNPYHHRAKRKKYIDVSEAFISPPSNSIKEYNRLRQENMDISKCNKNGRYINGRCHCIDQYEGAKCDKYIHPKYAISRNTPGADIKIRCHPYRPNDSLYAIPLSYDKQGDIDFSNYFIKGTYCNAKCIKGRNVCTERVRVE